VAVFLVFFRTVGRLMRVGKGCPTVGVCCVLGASHRHRIGRAPARALAERCLVRANVHILKKSFKSLIKVKRAGNGRKLR